MFAKKIKFGFIIIFIVCYAFLNGCTGTLKNHSLLDDPILNLNLDSLLFGTPDTIPIESETFVGKHKIMKNGVTITREQEGETSASITSDGKMIFKKYLHQNEEVIIDMKQMFENLQGQEEQDRKEGLSPQ